MHAYVSDVKFLPIKHVIKHIQFNSILLILHLLTSLVTDSLSVYDRHISSPTIEIVHLLCRK